MREVLQERQVIALHKNQHFFWPYIAENHVHNVTKTKLSMEVVCLTLLPLILSLMEWSSIAKTKFGSFREAISQEY